MDEETGQYTIGSATFDSLTELVLYYEKHPLYRRMKLKYAISDEILKSLSESSGGQEDLYAYYFPPDLSRVVSAGPVCVCVCVRMRVCMFGRICLWWWGCACVNVHI